MTETHNKTQQLVVILLLITIFFYFQELPASNVLQNALPEYPYILTLYFSVSSRYFFGVFSAFIVGIFQDVFLGVQTIGLHAAIYVLSAYVMLTIRLRFRHMSIFSQSLFIGMMVALKVTILILYETILYSPPVHFWVFLSVPLSMLIWPLVHMFFSFFAAKYI